MATVLKTEQIEVNTTYFNFEQTCGINNCQSDKLLISTSDPTKASIYTLLGILLLINIFGILTTVFFMDKISYKNNSTKSNQRIGEYSQKNILFYIYIMILKGAMFKSEVMSMIKLFENLDVYLLFPMSIFTGFELTFIWNEYNRVC